MRLQNAGRLQVRLRWQVKETEADMDCPGTKLPWRLSQALGAGLVAFGLSSCTNFVDSRYNYNKSAASELQDRLERREDELARAQQQINQSQDQVDRQLAKSREIQDVLEKRIRNLREENDRLNADLTGAVMNVAADRRNAVGAIVNASSQRVVGFEVPRNVSDKLTAFASSHPGLAYDPADRAIRFQAATAFLDGGDRLKPDMRSALRDLAGILNSEPARNLNFLIVGHTARATVRRELAPEHPTDWHLAANQAIAVQQLMEEQGLSPTRAGIASYASQQPLVEGDSRANARIEIFLLPPDPPADDRRN